jgi:hypothetical protein
MRSRAAAGGTGWSVIGRSAAVLVLCLLALPAAATVAAAGWAVVQAVGLDYAEPVVYGLAMRLVSGETLYQSIDTAPFTVAAYTPVYYWMAAALQVLVGTGFGPGRLLSLITGCVAAVLVGVIAGRRTGGLWGGALAALLFLALGFPGQVPWLGLYRVDLPGVAFSLAAVALLARTSGTPGVVAAGVLAGLALLCKQTFVSALLAGVLWQWRDVPKASAFFASGLLTFAIPCLVLQVTTDGAFVQNTLAANVNPFHPSVAAGLLSTFLATQWLPLLLASLYLAVCRPWQTSESRLLVLYWGASSLWLLGIAKLGAGSNYWIEFAAATAILAARGAALVLSTSRGVLAGAAGLLLLVTTAVGGPATLLGSARTVRSDMQAVLAPSRNVEFEALVDRVRREPGAVLAEPMDVLVLAGRPVLLEPYIYNLLLDSGRWRPESLVARICNAEITLLVLAYPLEVGARMSDGLYALWPEPIMTALQNSMSLDAVQATRYVYTPRPAPTCVVPVA